MVLVLRLFWGVLVLRCCCNVLVLKVSGDDCVLVLLVWEDVVGCCWLGGCWHCGLGGILGGVDGMV